jgi:hypothetical protein
MCSGEEQDHRSSWNPFASGYFQEASDNFSQRPIFYPNYFQALTRVAGKDRGKVLIAQNIGLPHPPPLPHTVTPPVGTVAALKGFRIKTETNILLPIQPCSEMANFGPVVVFVCKGTDV